MPAYISLHYRLPEVVEHSPKIDMRYYVQGSLVILYILWSLGGTGVLISP
jgi:hypothetical protein